MAGARLVIGDLDNDGDNDLAVANCGGTIDTLDTGLSKAAYGPCTPESPPPCFTGE